VTDDRLGRATGLAGAGANASASPGASERDLTVTSRAWKSSFACVSPGRITRVVISAHAETVAWRDEMLAA
jgi:hypothetical protein